jgi:hypothetical protein
VKPPAFSFRNLPFSIYLAVGLGFVGSLVFTIAFLMTSGEGYERYQASERARIFNLGCQYAQIFLYSCGLFALARRHTGPARSLAVVAAALMLIGLWGPGVNLIISIVEPREIRDVFDAVGLVELFVMLASSILLTIAADAWRRVPLAAIGLVLLHVTSYAFPVIGKAIGEQMTGQDTVRIYYVFREALWTVTLLFVASALAAGGRDLAPEPRRAASGFHIAHMSLIIRLVAAISLALMAFAAQSPGIAKLVLVGGPVIIIGTQIAFAIGILRVDSANLPGMSRVLLAVAAAGLFWFASLQLEQIAYILGKLWDGNLDDDDVDHVKLFSVVGPIVVTIALTLVGLAIAGFATHRGNLQLATSARSRTYAFVALALGGVALQAFMLDSKSLGSAVFVGLLAAAAGIAGLVVLAGLLKSAGEQVDAEPGLPPARVVSDS